MKTLAISILLTFLSFPSQADETIPFEKDIRIFENVLTTMLELDSPNRSFHLYDDEDVVKGTYLKNQGLLIEINSLFASNMSRKYRTFAHIEIPDFPRDFEFPEVPSAPELEDRLDEIRAAYEQELEAQEEEQEWIESEREYLREDLRKELQEARREQRKAQAKLKAELRALKNRAKDKQFTEKLIQEELEKSRTIHKRALEVFQQKMTKFKQQHQDNWAVESEKIKNAIIDALCQYGATIRTVKSGEYFTLILKGFEPNDNGKRLDRIYVFSHQSVVDCRDGKISQEDLVASADTYTSN